MSTQSAIYNIQLYDWNYRPKLPSITRSRLLTAGGMSFRRHYALTNCSRVSTMKPLEDNSFSVSFPTTFQCTDGRQAICGLAQDIVFFYCTILPRRQDSSVC